MFQTESADSAVVNTGLSDLAVLKDMSLNDIISKLARDIGNFFLSLAIAIAVFYIGRYIIRKIYAFIFKVMTRRNVEQSLTTFVLSLVNILLYFILIVTVIGILGINTSSFIALFASAGVAIGMALSGTLQNFAGGVLILLLKPYKVGDFIEAQGYSGTVREIQIFSTIICTADNKTIIIPNGGLSTGSINNWSRQGYRRIEWTVSLAYGDDLDIAKKELMDILLSDERVVRGMIYGDGTDETVDPDSVSVQKGSIPLHAPINAAPTVALSQLADSSINLTVRAWAKSSDFWPVYNTVIERIYKELPEHGLHFPYPQMDVHLVN